MESGILRTCFDARYWVRNVTVAAVLLDVDMKFEGGISHNLQT